MISQTLLAYLAGIIDGEGYIGIKKYSGKNCVSPTFHERITVCMSEKYILDIFKKNFGGYIHTRKFKNKIIKTNKIGYAWETTDRKAANIIMVFLPYLKVKKEQAKIVLKLRKSKETYKKPSHKKMAKNILTFREKIYNDIKKIHGNHHN